MGAGGGGGLGTDVRSMMSSGALALLLLLGWLIGLLPIGALPAPPPAAPRLTTQVAPPVPLPHWPSPGGPAPAPPPKHPAPSSTVSHAPQFALILVQP